MPSLKNQQLPRLLLTCHDSKQAEDSKQGPPDGGSYYLGPPTVQLYTRKRRAERGKKKTAQFDQPGTSRPESHQGMNILCNNVLGMRA